MTRWEDLQTKGYVVIPQAFNSDVVEALVTDFNRGAPPEKYPHGFKLVSRRGLNRVKPLVEGFLTEIREQTSLKVDTINFLTYSHYVTTKLAKKVSHLHQDFDIDFQLTGDHINYLNFWVPIVKPDIQRSNIRVIPLDSLTEEAEELLMNGGGNRLTVTDGKTLVEGRTGSLELELDLEQHGVDLHTSAGDLVVLRGDVPHRTQDVDTLRVAASIRATSSQKMIEKSKAQVEDTQLQEMLERCFEGLGKDSVTIKDFIDFSQGKTS